MLSKKLVSASCAAVLLAVSAGALAQNTSADDSNVYFGANYASADHETAFGDIEYKGIYGRLGVQLHENFALEARLGAGLGDDTLDVAVGQTVVPIDVELKSLFGVYGRLGVNAGEHLHPYLVAGLTRIDIEGCVGALCVEVSDSDFSYGAGAEIRFSEKVALNIEYMNWYDDGGEEVAGTSFGLTFSY